MKIINSAYKKRKSPFINRKNKAQNNIKKVSRFRKMKGKRKVITMEEAYPKLVEEIFEKLWASYKQDEIRKTERMNELVPQDALRRLEDASGEIKHTLIAEGFDEKDVSLYLKELVESE